MQVFSQDVGFPSPTAANLGKYVEHNVNLYSGTPGIQIPIYSIKTGDLGMSINLAYDAKGIKVAEIPDWVGAGWALNAGGVITRKVNGLPDERPNSGYLDMESQLNNLESALSDGLDEGDAPYYNLLNDMYNKTKDSQPDIFYFNFNGSSGKFILGHEGDQPSTIPQTDWEIEYTPGPETIESFTMTAPNGITYTFDEVEKSLRQPGEIAILPEYGTAWYLKKIESPDSNREITLTYQSSEVVHKYNNEEYELIHAPGTAISQYFYQLHSRKNLKQITTESHKIIFNRELRNDARVPSEWDTNHDEKQEYRLNSIDIKTVNNNLVKSVIFTYDYYANRLFLEGVHQQDANSNDLPGHSFEYINPSGLPGRLSKAIDHWGYYNGATDNTGFISSVYWYDAFNNEERYYIGADREVNTITSQYGVLNKITFPTGGSVTNEYEQNRYSDVYYDPSINIGAVNFTDYVIPISKSLSSKSQIENEQFSDGGLEPVLVSVNMTYQCSGNYLDHYGLYVQDDSHASNEGYIVIDESGNSNTTCDQFRAQNANRPVTNISSDLVLNEGVSPGNTFDFNFNQKSPAYEGDDYVYLSYTVSGLAGFREKDGPGLRVKKVTIDDGLSTSPNIIKTYDYKWHSDPPPFDVGSGVIYSEPRYVRTFYDPYGSGTFSDMLTGLTATQTLTFGNGENGFAGYTQVTEKIQGRGDVRKTFYDYTDKTALANTILNDYSEFYFAYDTQNGSNPIDLLNTNANIGQYNGKTKILEQYNESGSRLKRQEFTENDTDDYSNHQETTYFGLAFDTKSTGSSTVPYLKPYTLVIPFLANTEVTETTYEGGNSMQVNTTTFYEDNHKIKTKVVSTNSNGEERTTEYEYAHEEHQTDMEALNMLNQPYSTTIKNGSGNVLQKQWTLWFPYNIDNETYWLPCGSWQWDGSMDNGEPKAPPNCSLN